MSQNDSPTPAKNASEGIPQAPKPRLSRWLILFAGVVTAMGCGCINIWSIFNKPLMAMYGYSITEVSLAFSLYLLFACTSSIFAGWLQQRFPYRGIVFAAGICLGIGWFGTGSADSLFLLYLFFGGFAGAGNGMLYNTIMAVIAQWFPDKRGLANGICVGSMGLGPALVAPLGNILIESFDVMTAFHIVGLVWIAIYLCFSWMLLTPPAGWKPQGWTDNAADNPAKATVNINARQMFRQPLYYAIFALWAIAATSGVMITVQASDIGQNLAGLTASEGAIMVSMLAVGSFIGRLSFGILSDHMNRYNALAIALTVNALVMLFVIDNCRDFASYLTAVTVVGICLGALVCIIPTLVADAFGPVYFGQNYSFIYPAYTAASFIGPMIASFTVESTGTYDQAFVVAGCLAVLGIALAFLCKKLASQGLRNVL